MMRVFLVTMMFLPLLLFDAAASCPWNNEREKQEYFVERFNNLLMSNLTFQDLQNLIRVELPTTDLDTCDAELFEYFGHQSAKTKYINVSNVYFLYSADHSLIRTLNKTSGLNDELDYVFALDQKDSNSPKPSHYKLVDNNDYGWCNTIKPDWLRQGMISSECQITESVPVCEIDMANRSIEQLVDNIKAECDSAKLVRVTNINGTVSGQSLDFLDDLPVNTVYFDGPGTLEFDLEPNQAAITLTGNKKLYLKGMTLRSHNDNGIGIHVKAGELRLQATLIEGFDYGVISEKNTRVYAWHEKVGYRGGNNSRIIANHTGVTLYQTKEVVFINTQIEPEARAIAHYNSSIQKSKTPGNKISLEQSDLARHTLWLQGAETVRFLKLDSQGEPLALAATDWDCVYDRKTGLIWKADEFSSSFTFDKALKEAEQTQLCGLKNWRLPKNEELYGLAKRSTAPPAIDTQFFPSSYFEKNDYYWSSTPVIGESDKRWTVNFRFGFDNHQLKSEAQRLRLVSGDAPFSLNGERFQQIKKTPCIKDTLTQLVWLIPTPTESYKWSQQKEKLAFIDKINQQKTCGFSDWRLPQPENLYLLANRTKQSASKEIMPAGTYWSKWPNYLQFDIGSLSFPKGNHVGQDNFFPYEAYLILVRGKDINFGEARP
ncbi:DUF1566 domain-containing protein [Candidatus Parabeggiatoa sp. HSG14]|uniref:DUF1566 domain-containing protein n=1 Tax=Candidatus Parabeggiatoa sp. HSG14 TaxID=3055593 RepID=UPI0025A90BC9|nr:DUF1566 domain-containing protein [Thiotrichales bacterium HSG14]